MDVEVQILIIRYELPCTFEVEYGLLQFPRFVIGIAEIEIDLAVLIPVLDDRFIPRRGDIKDEFVEGESERIEYDGRADTVKFINKAKTRRLRGATLADEITGELIVYENLTDTFRVDGSSAKDASGKPVGRFRGMLTPKPEGAASTPTAGANSQSGPVLRPAAALGSAPK